MSRETPKKLRLDRLAVVGLAGLVLFLAHELRSVAVEQNQLAARVEALSRVPEEAPSPAPEDEPAPSFPHAELWVAEDGTVHRSGPEGSAADGLTWVIVRDGRVVLERDAADETQYRYFGGSGSYVVYLEARVGDRDRVVSNVVAFRR